MPRPSSVTSTKRELAESLPSRASQPLRDVLFMCTDQLVAVQPVPVSADHHNSRCSRSMTKHQPEAVGKTRSAPRRRRLAMECQGFTKQKGKSDSAMVRVNSPKKPPTSPSRSIAFVPKSSEEVDEDEKNGDDNEDLIYDEDLGSSTGLAASEGGSVVPANEPVTADKDPECDRPKRKRSDDILDAIDVPTAGGGKVMLLRSIYEGREPTVFFPYPPQCEEERHSDRTVPMEEKRKLKFKITSSVYAYNCVINALRAGGLTETGDAGWNVLWSAPLRHDAMKGFTRYQRCNHFPSTWQLGGKDNLWKNVSRYCFRSDLSRMRRKYGEPYDICPQTFLLPDDYKRLNAEREADPKSLWILKPVASSCGRGIRVIPRSGTIPRKSYPFDE